MFEKELRYKEKELITKIHYKNSRRKIKDDSKINFPKIIFTKIYKNLPFVVSLEENRIILDLYWNLIPASRPNVTKNGTFFKEPYKSFRSFLDEFLQQNILTTKYFKFKYCHLDLMLYYKIPKSKSKVLARFDYINSRPDLDNLEICIMNAFQSANVIEDDSKFCKVTKFKKWNSFNRSIIILNFFD